MKKRTICVVSGARSEYDLLFPILKKIVESKSLELQLIVTSSHLSSEFGMTYKKIEDDGFFINDKIENLLASDTKSAIAKSSGLASILLSNSFEKLNPDAVLLLGDRSETHAAATSAMLMDIPIVHIHGGEITEGSSDDKIRHSITKMSGLHFCSTEIHRQRIIQMGEDPLNVFNSGAPGIDNIINSSLILDKQLEEDLGLQFYNTSKTALITYHPEIMTKDSLIKDFNTILECLFESKLNIVFTYANADSGGRRINQMIEDFCKQDLYKYKVFKNLGRIKYLSLMSYVDILIGNSSSGIIEAASFAKPVINIENRQKGRTKNLNVLDSNIKSLKSQIEIALSDDFENKIYQMKNIYGDGRASEIIIQKLELHKFSVNKKFIDNV